MRWINTISASSTQMMTLSLPTGDQVNLNLWYSEPQRGWLFGLAYGTFTLNNLRVVTSVNLLRKFRNLLPFGFACTTNDGYEPVFRDDFSNGRAKFFILDSTDIVNIETMIVNGKISAQL